MSIPDKNTPYFQRFFKDMQKSWFYRSLAWVKPKQAGWVFIVLALVTTIFICFSIYGDNTNYIYTHLAAVMILLTILAGFFGLSTWSIDKYIQDEETKIAARCGLYSGVVFYLFIMILTILRGLH